ncbi:calcium ATPase transmembrane domain M-containing protein [Coniophora puteana RWD-64-598 SS2]|uniref:Calcium ATPase transmembrane domain M-containing protein n=1 Tax=Coniophora puteana (strain RWD-64-598) TaxID=741705 RepID=A0A5M3MLV2_CONPW|nr:calcium ATPase transmembrane domain M-containing protein [Coniophora puteana RWD-64-598 SS2]EIW79754.1 calcium ATPase transmembrane domain M-containing protein [Coniophora puteana RWD-64-598 SS2]
MQRTSTIGARSSHGIPIDYRTLSIRVDERDLPQKTTSADPVDAIANIDVHLISTEDVFTRYSTHPDMGLEPASVERKLTAQGKNLISPPPTQYWKKGLNYVFGGFNFLMWLAFILVLLSYEPLGGSTPAAFNLGVAVLLIIVIAVSALFYALVDWNASRIMKSIKSLIAEDAAVIREGKQQMIPAADIVVGDLIALASGDRVPADLRIVQASSDLRFDRSLLTGESDMIPGSLTATSDNALETRNLALTSTFVVQGSCTGVAFATGDRTVMGRLVSMSGDTKFKLTTIQREVWYFTKIISVVALSFFSLSLLLWGVWLRTSYPGFATASMAIVNSIGCLTAFVPQGLPVSVALSLTVIARRMSKRHVLVKNLATIETLGCMSVLCSDKTGTLTAGKMFVENFAFIDRSVNVNEDLDNAIAANNKPLAGLTALHQVARLCNAAKFDGSAKADVPIADRAVKGDPTDTALLRFSDGLVIPDLGIDSAQLLSKLEKIFEIPFNSKNKWAMTVVRKKGSDETFMLVKGGPDVLFGACSRVMLADGSETPLDARARQELTTLQSEWSSEGQRVLALCRRSLDGLKPGLNANEMEELMYAELQELTLIGLVGIRDPPRSDVPAAIEVIRRAGVRVFMVTGDFKLTAVSIARQVGIVSQKHIDSLADVQLLHKEGHFAPRNKSLRKPDPDDPIRALVLTGDEVSCLSSSDWDVITTLYTEIVFARMTPDQKMRIVEEIKARGDNTVAVTGDGVNDAPALKAADIGVAMGSGSDVAKEAAALVLLNNDFASIPVAIEMGRLVFDNLRKVTLFLMTAGSYGEFMATFSNVFLGMQIPMSSYLQVCFCITNDVVMAVSLMYEKAEADLMLRKPRNVRTDRLADWKVFFQVYFVTGLMQWVCAMAMWFLYMSQHGLGFYNVFLVYNKWTSGWQGYSTSQLTHFASVGECCYYVTLVIMQWGGLMAARNRRVSILTSNPLWGPRKNLVIIPSMITTILIAIVNFYGPGLQHVFATAPIPGIFWGLPFAFALGIVIFDEARKLVVRTYPKSFIAKIAW